MESFFNSFLLVFAGEMGDKTQLLAIVLATRFKKPWTILLGVLIATLLNHALAAYLGEWISAFASPLVLKWSLALMFFAFAIWLLFPDQEGEVKGSARFGALTTTVIAFFIAEMGDKTQLATIALGAKYANTLVVTIGTTLGMLAANALAIFMGERLLRKVPMQWVRMFASGLFVAFGIAIVVGF